MKIVKFIGLIVLWTLSGCASQEELAYHNMDNECLGTIEREYSITLNSDTPETTTQHEVTCMPLEHDPFKGQKEPTTDELKELRDKQ